MESRETVERLGCAQDRGEFLKEKDFFVQNRLMKKPSLSEIVSIPCPDPGALERSNRADLVGIPAKR